MKSKFTTDDRGVSEVIGAILVFGLLIALMAIIQTQAVPAANQEVEFDHHQEVQGDLTKFHERASRVSAHGTSESISIQSGTGYPTRMLFFNPPRASGTISTSDPGTATISNVEAIDPEVADYLDGSQDVEIDSRALEYRVDYNHYKNAPTSRYEYGILYDKHRDNTIVKNSGSVIDDTNINLVFMQGNYSRSSASAQSLDVEPVSAPARPVTVTGSGNNNIVLTLPTEMPVEKWEEYYLSQDTVISIDNVTDSNEIEITLDGAQTYTLRMAGLGLEQGVEKPDALYIVPADDGVSTIGAGDNATVKYEVRDKYNNPVSGVDVIIDGETRQTNGDGRVTKSVNPGNPTTFTGQIEGCTSGEWCYADYRVQVTDLNPNPSSGVTLVKASTGAINVPLLDASLEDDELAFTLESDSDTSMSKFRINHYHPDPDGHSPASLRDEDENEVTGIEVGGSFVDASDGLDDLNEIQAGEENPYILTFDSGVGSDNYVVLTIVFDNGDRALYFVSPS